MGAVERRREPSPPGPRNGLERPRDSVVDCRMAGLACLVMEDLIAALPDGLLPPGRLVAAHDGGPPRYWLSDGPAPPGLWPRLRAQHTATGLWPLLLGGLDGPDDPRPWAEGEVFPAGMTSPADHDAATVLAGWWAQNAADDEPALTPFGRQWPGLSDAVRPEEDPDAVADAYAEEALDQRLRLGLAAATRGADALTVTGWNGPANHAYDTAVISAVVRSWEERFGARVVAVGFGTLALSVAAPPTTEEQALRVAAEHAAFCPDLVRQGAESLEAYAATILDRPTWWFWWD